ncbi:MAG: hypothetical protein K5846_02275 [Bacteroidales bacterium]|nr:hypothetical protein [Bacteroidales bacterium]
MSKSPFLILFLAVLCLCSSIRAQEPIDVYDGEMDKYTLADWNLNGPVKTAIITTLFKMKGDSVFHKKMKTILNFDTAGRLAAETMIGWGNFENKDTVMDIFLQFQYDDLNRCTACFGPDNLLLQDFVYDENGNLSYCVYTHDNGKPKPSWRYYYDEKGRCTRREYIPGTDEDYLDYTIYQHYFQYDSMDHCIEKVTMLDGDTETVKRLKYDVRGNITEEISYDTPWNCVDHFCQELYFYDDEGRLVRSQTFYNHVEQDERFYEYNHLNQLIRRKTYNKKEGYLSDLDEMFYDRYGNCVEYIYSSFLHDQSPGAACKTTYEYEYADE